MKVSKTLFATVLATLATTSHGCMSPSPTNPAICPSGTTTGSGSCSNNNNNVFGIPGARRAVLNLRGGELHEPSTLEEVNSLVLRAGSAGQLVVVDFTATWCGPCQMIAPLYKEMSETYDDVVFLKVDVDENADTAQHYSVSAMPTFLFIKGGVVLERVMGANAQRLKDAIEQHM